MLFVRPAISSTSHVKFRTCLLRRGIFVLWGGWGERKRKRARFIIIIYFYRDTQQEPLRRREVPHASQTPWKTLNVIKLKMKTPLLLSIY